MNQKNKYIAMGGTVAAVAVIGWFALSHVATNRAEESIYAFLDQYGIRQAVQWENLTASPFGKVDIENVSIRMSPKTDALRIARIQLKDFVDTADRISIDLQLSDMSNGQGHSPLGVFDYVQAGGRATLPPLSVHVKWDIRLDDDEGTVKVSFNQPDAMEAELDFEVDKIAVLANLGHNTLSESLNASGRFNLFGGHPLLLAAQSVLEPLGEVRVKGLNASIKDQGHMARSIALYTRYSIDLAPTESNPDKAREKKFKEQINSGLKGCQREAGDAFKGVPKVEDSCEAVLDFASGESKSLTLTAKPIRPVSMSTLFQTGMSRPEDAVVLMNPVFN